MAPAIEIVAYQDKHAEEFARLNREWLDRFGLYEEADAKHLYFPREYILDMGFYPVSTDCWVKSLKA